MRGLSFPQRQVLANFCTNTAVGWFVAGIVTPFLTPATIAELYVRTAWGLFMAYVFLRTGVSLVEE